MSQHLDDIPSIKDPTILEAVPCPGDMLDMLCDSTDEGFRRRLKHLLLFLSQNETAITLAKCRGLEIVEVEGVLTPRGTVEEGRQFNLECYADPELRTFFDALGIEVER